MEEIGYCSAVFTFGGLASGQRDYIGWLLTACAAEGVAAGDMMTESAIALLADRLRTPCRSSSI